MERRHWGFEQQKPFLAEVLPQTPLRFAPFLVPALSHQSFLRCFSAIILQPLLLRGLRACYLWRAELNNFLPRPFIVLSFSRKRARLNSFIEIECLISVFERGVEGSIYIDDGTLIGLLYTARRAVVFLGSLVSRCLLDVGPLCALRAEDTY